MKDIKTLANDLNISKETIYKKINGVLQSELQDHKFKKNGKLYIDEIGESLILQSLRRENEEVTDAPGEEENKPSDNVIVNDNVITKDIQTLELINVLKHQLEEKDKQIVMNLEYYKEQLQTKDNQIKELSNKNNELDTHLQELNNQLIGIITGEQQIKIGTIITDNNKINSTSVLKEKVTDDIVEPEATATQNNNHNNRPNRFTDAPIKKSWLDILFKR